MCVCVCIHTCACFPVCMYKCACALPGTNKLES